MLSQCGSKVEGISTSWIFTPVHSATPISGFIVVKFTEEIFGRAFVNSESKVDFPDCVKPIKQICISPSFFKTKAREPFFPSVFARSFESFVFSSAKSLSPPLCLGANFIISSKAKIFSSRVLASRNLFCASANSGVALIGIRNFEDEKLKAYARISNSANSSLEILSFFAQKLAEASYRNLYFLHAYKFILAGCSFLAAHFNNLSNIFQSFFNRISLCVAAFQIRNFSNKFSVFVSFYKHNKVFCFH